MAQTIEEIFNELVAEKENSAALNGLMPQYGFPVPSSVNPFIQFLKDINTSSSSGLWRLWLFIVAVAIHAQQVLFDWHIIEVNKIIANHKPGTLGWYRSQLLKFQINDALVLVNEVYQYAVTDPDARIIVQCSVEKAAGVRVRVAKSDGAGGLMKLDNTELAQAQAYIDRIRYADHDLLLFSFDPDTVRLAYTILYDPLVDLAALKLEVKAAQKQYLLSLGNNATRFGGKIVLNEMVDVLQAHPAVRNPVPNVFEAKYGALPFVDYLAVGSFKSNAGYAVLDEAYFDAHTIWEADI
jgi:hypothetical protein